MNIGAQGLYKLVECSGCGFQLLKIIEQAGFHLLEVK